MDQNAPRPELRLESLHQAELLPISQFNQETAARLAYQERGSLGLAWNETFRQADQQPYEWSRGDDEQFSQRFGTNSEAMRAFIKHILGGLKDSDAVNHFRQVKGNVESEQEMRSVFNAFERSVARAFRAVPLSEKQRNEFREAYGERDFGLAAVAVELAGQMAEAKDQGIEFDDDGNTIGDYEFKHHPFSAFLIGQPKIRPVDYMDTKEGRGYLRRFGAFEVSETAKSQMKSDLGHLDDITRQAA